jgi:hypothetical protein
MGRIEFHPNPRIEIRLPEKKPIRRFGPEPDLVDFVVEDEISCRCAGGQDGVTFTFFVFDNRHEEGARRPSEPDQLVSLQESVVLTVAFAVGGEGPVVGDAVVFQIPFRCDRPINPTVDLVELG